MNGLEEVPIGSISGLGRPGRLVKIVSVRAEPG
jgi:hypothetical protein